MKNFWKQTPTPQFLLVLFFVTTMSFTAVYAQSSIADVCGQTATDPKCTVADIGKITKNLLTFVIGLGLPLLVVVVVSRFVKAWFALQQGNPNAYKEALDKSWNAILGFFLIVALFGGLMYVLLNYLGIKEGPLKILHMFSDAFIPHAYAQSAGASPLNLTGANNLYDFILSMLRLIMRFFVYPALIIIWVWTGFGFVMAQGNPDGLNKAKKWLLWAFATTFLIFLLQTFLIAAQGTVNKILPGTEKTLSAPPVVQNTTPGGQVAPVAGADGSVCPIGNTYGQMAGGVCMPGRGGSSVGGVTLIQETNGWKYYSDGTAIGPDGTYYSQGQAITGPGGNTSVVKQDVMYTCPDGTKVQSSDAKLCPKKSQYVDSCSEKGTQLNSPCVPEQGGAGACKFNLKTNAFVCIGYRM